MRHWTRRLALLAAAAVALVLPAPAAGAASGGPIAGGTALSHAHPVLGFQGEFDNPTPLPMIGNPDPTVCVPQWCQQWSLAVDTTDPFLVSIRNTGASIDDGLNLSVNAPDGSQAGSSSGVGSDGQAVAVEHPQPGTYQVFVTVTYQYDPTAQYLGEARIMAPPSWKLPHCDTDPCPVLPALRALPPSDVHVDGIPPVASTPLGFPFPFTIPTGNSCYLDETATSGATRCLRFTSEIDNTGLGALQLRLSWLTADGQSGFVPGECRANQVITWTDGTTTMRPAGPCEFHPQHGHFHYDAFVSFALYRVQPDGSIGAQPIGQGLKESFCLADDGYFGFGTAGPNGPRGYEGQPGCNVPSETDASGAWVDEGVSPGWGDIYTWDTPTQYIDVTNLPAGTYDILTRTNPDGLLELAGPAQQCSATRIALTATDVKVVSSEADVTCPPA